MLLNSLNAISPIDGRYAEKTKVFRDFFSEQALINYRVLVEIEYFISLTKTEIQSLEDFPKEAFKKIKLRNAMCIAQIKRGLATQAPFPSNSHT